jgi:hypothetical protein
MHVLIPSCQLLIDFLKVLLFFDCISSIVDCILESCNACFDSNWYILRRLSRFLGTTVLLFGYEFRFDLVQLFIMIPHIFLTLQYRIFNIKVALRPLL